MERAIEVEGLVVTYRGKRGAAVEAVRGLDFEVRPGEVVGFLGPNGAGKSSTLKALMGFVEPASGSCRVAGHPAGSLEAKRHAGYLPEVAQYYPFLTPLETLTLYGELQGLKGDELRHEAHELLDMVGLGAAHSRQNRTLSKGMLQRVGIAQALLGSPDVLVLDEVTSGLDPVGRRELRAVLRERRNRGCTLLFSSHELSEVEMLCDRIVLIEHGRLIEERNVEALKDELRRFSIVYRGQASMIGLSEEWRERSDGTFYARFTGKKGLMQAMERVFAAGAELIDVTADQGSFEDYFVQAIGRSA